MYTKLEYKYYHSKQQINFENVRKNSKISNYLIIWHKMHIKEKVY